MPEKSPESPRGRSRPRPSKISKNNQALQVLKKPDPIQGQALQQFRQLLRSAPNRSSLALTLSKDLFLVLRYIPNGIYSKIQNSILNNVSAATGSNNPAGPSTSTNSSSQLRFQSSEDNNNNSNKNNKSIQKSEVPSTSNISSTSTQSILTDLYGKAAYATILVRERMLNRSLSLNSSMSTSAASTPKSEEVKEAQKKGEEEEKKQVLKAEERSSTVPDWTSDPDLKPFLRDMNVEWKNIEARTKYLVSKVNAVVQDERNTNRVKMGHLEDLYNHLSQYREARLMAVESGAVKSLSRILKSHQDESCVINCVRETLAILGCNPTLKGHGIKVLSIDGGGVRGLVAIEVLRMIEKQTGQKIHEIFDYICGVSTGSILAFLIGAHRRTLDECESLYKQLSRDIFNQNSIIGAGSLFWSHSYYNTANWEKILKKHIGDGDLMNLARDPDLPRVAAISTVVNQERVTPYVFRTYAFNPSVRSRYSGGNRYKMWEAVRASAAAPSYFEEIKLGNNLHQDGGVLVNNPTSLALSEAKNIWQGQPLQCVVSLGTGQTFSSRKDPNMSDLANPPDSKSSPNSLSWKGKFLKVLDSATDTESVHHTLMELLPPDQYFRFNPHLNEMITMDEARPEKLEKLQEETREYLMRNLDKLEYSCHMLTRPKGMTKKVYDWWTAKL